MFFFFFFNNEKRLGFKHLTKSDLGLGDSHQTHIGLYEDVFTFLQDSDVVKSAMLIYDDYCEILDCSFDRIQNQDGSFRSPKIKVGNDSANSVVTMIRKFAKNEPDADWYLIWSGLESEELTFWLIRKGSDDYKSVMQVLPVSNKVYSDKDQCYPKAIELLTLKVNNVSLHVQKEIETASQIGNFNNKYKKVDIERAEKAFKEIGKKGEILVNEYLSKQKVLGKISSFEWQNSSRESGNPYDFVINNRYYVDVKSTGYDFNQNVYFSNQEISFACLNNDVYSVYRVYGLNDKYISMNICSQCNPYLSHINGKIIRFINDIERQDAGLSALKLSVLPSKCFTNIQSPIKL